MKNKSNYPRLSVLAIALMVLVSACSSVNNEVESISDEDVDLAAHVVATSLSDDESGLISSLYDAVSDVDAQGIVYGPNGRFKSTDKKNHSGRGLERNFTHTYDSTTGVHSISFSRSVSNEVFSKSLEVSQEIIYTDLEGNFIARPKADKSSIEAISFSGTKSGAHDGPFRSSSFTKADDFELTGMHSSSSVLAFSGEHNGSGSAEGVTRDSVEASRTYEISISFENVSVNKDTVLAYGSLEQGVTGTLTYSMTLNKTIGGVPEETIMEGTIDLEEDGTALLRFKALPQVIRFSLKDGERERKPGDGRGR